MKKIVTTEMTERSVVVTVTSGIDSAIYAFPFELCNPKTALHIATLLVSDPTVRQDDEKAE